MSRIYNKHIDQAVRKFSKERDLLKKHLDKKKGKELDFDDVKKSYKIFTTKKK